MHWMFLFIGTSLFGQSLEKEETKLLLVQTIFRHGERAPEVLYPTDPNNANDWPNGLGHLTQHGKEQQYKVGKFLRSMYKDFITTNPNEVYVNSSKQDRCLNSAESNLASFYAPVGKWKIADNLNWQPIPIHYLPTEADIYLDTQSYCPRSEEAVLSSLRSNEKIQEFYSTHQTMVEVVSNYSGLDYTDPSEAYKLFNTLQIESSYNLIIPEWAKTYWSEMSYISNEFFQGNFRSPIYLRLRYGPFLGLINKNLEDKISGNTPNLKFVVNSSHNKNVAGVLAALNFTNIPQPPFCATVLIELHEMADNSKAVRLLYLNSTDPLIEMEKPHVLTLNNCSEFCPVENFMESFQGLIPDNWSEECRTDTLASY